MILSFVIFVGFVFSLFFLLNPFQAKEITNTIVDVTEKTLTENWTIHYKTSSLTIKETVDQNPCVVVDNIPEIPETVLVKDQGETQKSASIHSNYGKIRLSSTMGNRFYMIYYSNDFHENAISSCGNNLQEGEYSFGPINAYDEILYDNIQRMETAYKTDYEKLKTNLGLQNDFMFAIYDESGAMLVNATKFVPRFTEVNARNVPITAITSSAQLKNVILNVRTW